MPFVVSLWLAVLIWIYALVAKGSSHSLGILFVYSNSSQYNSTEALAGVQEAIDNIEYEDIIPGYRVHIIVEIDVIEVKYQYIIFIKTHLSIFGCSILFSVMMSPLLLRDYSSTSQIPYHHKH